MPGAARLHGSFAVSPNFSLISTNCPHNLDPQISYDRKKLLGKNLARLYHRQNGSEILSLRIGQPFPLVPKLDSNWREVSSQIIQCRSGRHRHRYRRGGLLTNSLRYL